MVLTEKQTRELSGRILGMCRSDSASVSIGGGSSVNLRFANNDITTNGTLGSVSVSLTVSFGKRSASVSVNQTDERTLRNAVARAEAMARLAPENPEHMPPLGPAEFDRPIDFSEQTAEAGPAELAAWVKPVIEHSRSSGVVSAGFLERSLHASALATSNGLFVHQRSTSCDFSMTARTPSGGGSGWASTQVTDAARLNLEAVGKRAVAKAKKSRDPSEKAPGRTTVVLEAAAARDLIALVAWDLDRRSFDEKRSFLNGLSKGKNPVGEKLFGEKATLFSDPLDKAAPCETNSGGLPLRRTPWIENGVLRNLHVSRYWAEKNGTTPLPGPHNLIVPGDGVPLKELIAQVDDGVLITRFWYIRMVQPQSLLYTGLTRDGTFRIENGEVTKPVKNFRFNESPVNLLNNIVATGIPERVMGSEGGTPTHVPPLIAEGFNLSSVSDAS